MEKVGRYRLERRIGAGSFATVWLGHDDDLDVPVAVKVLADNWSANDDVRNRFLAEARIMRRIHDRRLVQVYDIGTIEEPDGSVGRPYFVMDYVAGGSLNDLRRAGLDPVRALRLCAEAARALEVLHENDIIHRDVTPGNLLLSVDSGGADRVLVADLGVAKSLIDAVGATMTAGTPSYMAPEQATGAVPLDRRADIYALTAVTYAMLTGKPPFVVTSVSDILRRDPAGAPAPIAELVGAPDSLDAVMLSGLAWDRQRRPPTASLLADGLDTIARQVEAGRHRSVTPAWSTSTSMPPGPAGTQASLPASFVATTYTPVSAQSAQSAQSAPSVHNSNPTDPYSLFGWDPSATVVTARPAPVTTRSSRAYWILLTLAALGVFGVSLLVTILLLR